MRKIRATAKNRTHVLVPIVSTLYHCAMHSLRTADWPKINLLMNVVINTVYYSRLSCCGVMTNNNHWYKHLITYDHYDYFRPLSEKERDFSLFRLATSDSQC